MTSEEFWRLVQTLCAQLPPLLAVEQAYAMNLLAAALFDGRATLNPKSLENLPECLLSAFPGLLDKPAPTPEPAPEGRLC